jgi:hypothetical protein
LTCTTAVTIFYGFNAGSLHSWYRQVKSVVDVVVVVVVVSVIINRLTDAAFGKATNSYVHLGTVKII